MVLHLLSKRRPIPSAIACPLLLPLGLILLGVASCKRATSPPPETKSPQPPGTASASASVRIIQRPNDVVLGPSATGTIGDYLLENGRIRAVITTEASSRGFAASAGNLVDLAAVDGEDALNEVFLYLEDQFPRQARYGKVASLTDEAQSEGTRSNTPPNAAVVVARGVDTHNPLIEIETRYILAPNASWITLETRFVSTATSVLLDYEVGDAVQWGRTAHMAPGVGFDLAGKRLEVDWIAGLGSKTSYAFVTDGPSSVYGPNGAVWSDPIGAVTDLKPNEPFVYRRHIVVGRGDTASMSGTIHHFRQEPTGRLHGRVTGHLEGQMVPIKDAVIQVLNEAEPAGLFGLFGTAKTDDQGRYMIELPRGRFRATAAAPGRVTEKAKDDGSVERVEKAEDAENRSRDELFEMNPGDSLERNFVLTAPGVLSWRVFDEAGRALPVRMTIVGRGATKTPRFGPAFSAPGAENFILSADGTGSTLVAPGEYDVIATQGIEREASFKTVSIGAGERVEIEAVLPRVLNTTGFLSADLHQHAAPSFDSGVSLADRALSNLVEGLDVLVATDHNTLTDYRATIRAAGFEHQLASIVGVEATTHSVGHFNAFPLRSQPGTPKNGMADPEGWAPSEIFTYLRGIAAPGTEAFIQINHPRSGGTGYYSRMGLDEQTGRPTDPRFSMEFDGQEVAFLGYETDTQQGLKDWMNLLLQGHRITGTGTSDSHTISFRPVGWPRTFVCAEDDDPARLDVAAFSRALREGCATISSGPFVTIRSGSTKMGGLLPARLSAGGARGTQGTRGTRGMGGMGGTPPARGAFAVDVEVQAARWIGVDRLVLWVDGRPLVEVPIREGDRRPFSSYQALRYKGTIPVRCAQDCFVLAIVDSKKSLAPVIGDRPSMVPLPFGITNPIYVDVDGDGQYRATSRRPEKSRETGLQPRQGDKVKNR